MEPSIVPVTLAATPQDLYGRLGAVDGTVLLESSMQMPGLSGWSWVTGPALATLETRGGATTLFERVSNRSPGRALGEWADPLEAIQAVIASLAAGAPVQRPTGLAFAGGLVGHLGYDLARFVERLPTIAADDPPLPALRLHLCDHLFAFEHATSQWYFCVLPTPWGDAPSRRQVWARTQAVAMTPTPTSAAARGHFRVGELASRTPADLYLRQVRTVLDFIAAGDIFQANLSHRLEATFEGDPYALYRALTARNPAPFSAYLPGDGFAIASVSPERFLKLEGREVVARPIKGTLPRDADAQRDEAQRAALTRSTKDRAENLMIVDLMRNDLGRVAQVGSVRVDKLFEAEPHPSVWQLVSTVRARLRDDKGMADLLRACWPPGSMTGAPKVRAMEIIESLEPVRRGPYAGGIGYFDAGGAMDLSVVIRTAIVHGARVMVQLGGAVVSDSEPAQELAETEAKGRFIVQAMRGSA